MKTQNDKVKNAQSGESAVKKPFLKHVKTAIFCVVLFAGLHELFHIIERGNPLSNKIEDFEIFDLILRNNKPGVDLDTNIIIVNCINDSRDEIAGKIQRISRDNPAAIGIDIQFETLMHDSENVALVKAIRENADKIVLVDTGTRKQHFNMQLCSGSRRYIHYGYVPVEDMHSVRRSFHPYRHNKNVVDTFFAVTIMNVASKISPKRYKLETFSNNEEVLINFKKRFADESRYDIYDSVNDPALNFKDRIVLLGSIGGEYSIYDKHYTPLNKYNGKAAPDMFGVEYIAQTLSMLVDNNLSLHEIPWYYDWALIFLCCLLSVRMQEKWHHNHYQHWLILIYIILCTIAFVFLSIFILKHFSRKLEPVHYIAPLYLTFYFAELYDVCVRFFNALYSFIKRKIFKVAPLVLLMLAISVTVTYAERKVKVESLSGTIKYSNDNKTWYLLSSKSQISIDAYLSVGENASAILIEEYEGDERATKIDGKVPHLTQVKKLKFIESEGDLLLAKVVLSKIYSPPVKKGGMSSSRTVGSGGTLMLLPADNEILIDKNLTFNWGKAVGASYKFFLAEKSNDSYSWICKSELSSDTMLNNSSNCLKSYAFNNTGKYVWTVLESYNKDDKPYFLNFSFADEQTVETVDRLLKKISASKDADDEIKMLLSAVCYENYQMYSKANEIYLKAKRAYPTSVIIGDAFEMFLLRVSALNQAK